MDIGLLFIQYYLKAVDKAIIICWCQSKPRTRANSPTFIHQLYIKIYEHHYDVQSVTITPHPLW